MSTQHQPTPNRDAARYACLAPDYRVIGPVLFYGDAADPWCLECDGTGTIETRTDVDSYRESPCKHCREVDYDEYGPCGTSLLWPVGCEFCCDPIANRDAWIVRPTKSDLEKDQRYAHQHCLDREVAELRRAA